MYTITEEKTMTATEQEFYQKSLSHYRQTDDQVAIYPRIGEYRQKGIEGRRLNVLQEAARREVQAEETRVLRHFEAMEQN